MNRSLVIPLCIIASSISPLICMAQSKGAGPTSAPADTSSAIVSVHELLIPEKARAACDKGSKRFVAKDSAGSIPEFQKAIKAFPQYYEAYAKLGAAEVDLEKWPDAEQAFRKSIELSGGHYAPANFGLALILATVTNHFEEAESVVRAGLATDPNDETGRFILGWVLYSTDHLEEAERNAREALIAKPDFAGGRLLLAQIHLREKRFAEAATDLDAYLSLGLTGPLMEKVRATRDAVMRELGPDEANAEIAKQNSFSLNPVH
jgi:tetratricopeptide (TPR) repeat protein